MPYFAWRGVNIVGAVKRGYSFARTQDELEAVLLKRDIALLRARVARQWFIGRSLGIDDCVIFFEQLSDLLLSGVLLPEALRIVADQVDKPALQEMLHELADAVSAGGSFADALGRYPAFFNELVCNSVRVGQETGKLGVSCHALALYLASVQTYKKKVRQALFMPVITVLFFCCIAALMLVFIVPRFATIFQSLGHQLPGLTRALVAVSNGLQGFAGLSLLGCIIGLFVGVRVVYATISGRRLLDGLLCYVPFVRLLVTDSARMHFLRSLSVLVGGGVSVPHAVHIARRSVSNVVLKEYIDFIERVVYAGGSLSQALAQHPEQWFEQSVVAMVRVGEESGQLPQSLVRAAGYYQRRVDNLLSRSISLLQPLFVVLLGGVVALFIYAIYMPIFMLADIVG